MYFPLKDFVNYIVRMEENNRMKPKLKPLMINRHVDFESVPKTAPVMDDAVNDLRAAIEEEVKKNNVTRTYSSVSHQGKS